jgi:hypothetical protein
MTISVVSALGLETLDAMAAASVSRIILHGISTFYATSASLTTEQQSDEGAGKEEETRTHPSSTVSSAASNTKSNPSKTFLLST